jgi:hypothetical protein
LKEALITPRALKVQADGDEIGVPARHGYEFGPSPSANPLPDTAMMTPACPDVALSVIVGVAFTVIELSTETNNAITRTRNVTANLARRKACKSKHTSLQFFD